MHSPSRFQFYQEVRIAHPRRENAEFEGELGAVVGLGTEPGEPVSVGVLVFRIARVVCFAESELTGTGRQYRREDFHDDRRSVRVRVDEQGRGWLG
jgi:hypothetical protein